MKKTLIAVLVVLGLACCLNTATVRAQEGENDKFSFGKVVSVAQDQITVKEYDFTKDADVETTYSLTPETELGNVNAVSDLVADDDIVIDFVEKDGKRVITTLVKEEKGAETPMPAAEGEAMAPVEPAPAVVSDAPAALPQAEAVDAAPAEMTPDLPVQDQPAAEPAEAAMPSTDEAAPAAAPAEQN